MKKIGYVIPAFPVLSETFVGVEMRAMREKGHEIQPFAFEATQGCQPSDTELAQSCQYISATLPKGSWRWLRHAHRCHQFLSEQEGFAYLSLLKQGIILAEMAAKAQCEHLHAHFAWHSAATAIVAAKLLNISVSFVGHGADIYSSPQDLDAKLDHASFGCAVTNDMQSHLQQMTDTPIHYVACGLESEHYPRFNNEWVPLRDFLFIGRLVEKKDLETLISAFRQLPKTAKLDIVGDGPLYDKLHLWISENHLSSQVTLLGSRNANWFRQNAPLYKALVAPFCIAKNGDRDTGPLVLKEAMGLGLPVITTDLAGCKEIVDEETGFKVPMRNPYALASTMQYVYEQPTATLLKLRQLAYERVFSNYNAANHAASLSQLVQSA
ncbi:glycosyltransferase family 4 protein [Thaumasiovibrio subtropicus]|uniref:glycosyltransferase family 4 protein n=1 Tax=Thaumasiovibrio subtropicus TaxID=1891207 RepID=UPI000B34E6A2|nr:glycosyltransferase family 4 protein [Thaumasiovibrio subtropicus]